MNFKQLSALSLSALITLSQPSILAASSSTTTTSATGSIYEMLVMMNLLTYDDSEELTISSTSTISRAEFAKALYQLAGYGTTATNSYVSPFADVAYTDSYAGYIRTVTSQGYMSGYAKGYFKPTQTITIDEALKALLRLLGYENSEIAGTDLLFQTARTSGLMDNISLTTGQSLTKKDYAQLIYNALEATMKTSQQTLAQSLGYTLRGDSLSISDVIDNDAVGPIALTGTADADDFGLSKPTTYLNGVQKSVSMRKGDVVYYSTTMNKLYVYRNYAYGTITQTSANLEAVTSFTAGGVTYKCSTDTIRELFAKGKLEVGDPVRISLDRDGNAAYASYYTQSDDDEDDTPSTNGGGSSSGGSTVVYKDDTYMYVVVNGETYKFPLTSAEY